ncbi:MAG TPA: hypothetical protein VJQ47_17410 [Steroidobacteraceae bacterium]|nr:hypothetical protein [Steroidobacteraceae bacterium]
MDHFQYKKNQTAADYVANGLDESTQEAFELHMMDCTECVQDVETWRAVKAELRSAPPRRQGRSAVVASPELQGWRLAASLAGVGLLGLAGGWLGKSAQTPDLDSTQTVLFNMPAVSRGGDECIPVKLAPDTRVVLLRVPGLARETQLLALDSEKRPLASSRYGVRQQPDGSQLMRLDADLVRNRPVYLESHHGGSSSEPIGCLTAASAP